MSMLGDPEPAGAEPALELTVGVTCGTPERTDDPEDTRDAPDREELREDERVALSREDARLAADASVRARGVLAWGVEEVSTDTLSRELRPALDLVCLPSAAKTQDPPR